MKQRSLHFLAVLTALLLPVCAWANIWQDPESKVNYEYTPGGSQASVKGGQYGELAGSPEVQGDVAILSSINVNGKEYKVTSIKDWAFLDCIDMTSVTIPNSVISIGESAFYGCRGLNSIIIPNSVKTIAEGTFLGCSGLTAVTIPNSVEVIAGSAFEKCSGLVSVTIPNSVTSIKFAAFAECSSLTSITIPNSITSIEAGAFLGCGGLTSITVEEGNPNYDSRNNCNAIINTKTNVLITGCNNTVIPNNVTRIEADAFSDCTGLTAVTIPNSVTSIGRNAFEGCSSLTSIIIPNSVTSIGNYAFDSCSGLTSIIIPNSVTSIENNPFDGCSGLTSIIVESGNSVYDSRNNCNALIHTATNKLIKGCENTVIPNTVTTIEEGAFDRCYGLNSITIPNSVKSIGVGTFAGCNSLTSIIVESGNTVFDSRDNCNAIIHTASHELIAGCKNTVIPNSVTSIGVGAFSGCRDLTSITIPNSVTSIGLGAFAGCNSLTSVNFGNSLTTIGSAAFFTCDGLTSVTIPNSVITIGEQAFCDCNDLISVTIPNSVTSIGDGAFAGCTKLQEVRSFIENPFVILNDVFENYDEKTNGSTFTTATLYVPVGTKAKYEATMGWKNFKTIIETTYIEPIEGEMTINTTNLSGEDLTDNVVNDVYYNITDGAYDATDGSIIISQPTNIGQISNKEPGSADVKEKFNGMILRVGKGKGIITVNVKTSGNAQLVVQIGNGTPMIASRTERGDVEVSYDVEEDTNVYIYAILGSSNATTRAVSDGEVRIYGVKVSPGAVSGITNAKGETTTDSRYYNLGGQRLTKPQKGINIVGGKKVFVP